MEYPTLKQIENIENRTGAIYPESYKKYLPELPDRYDMVKSIYPNGIFILNEKQFRNFAESVSGLIPFFLDRQPDHTDYYCFENTWSDKVVVFADHAIVFGWESLQSWFDWSMANIAEKNKR